MLTVTWQGKLSRPCSRNVTRFSRYVNMLGPYVSRGGGIAAPGNAARSLACRSAAGRSLRDCSLFAAWVSDGAAVVLDKSSKVASSLDQIDAEAEDVRLDGEGEAKIGAFPARPAGPP